MTFWLTQTRFRVLYLPRYRYQYGSYRTVSTAHTCPCMKGIPYVGTVEKSMHVLLRSALVFLAVIKVIFTQHCVMESRSKQ